MSKFFYNEKLLVRKMKDTTMIYNPDNGDMYELNDISQTILEKIQEGNSIEEIISFFSVEYDESEEVIRQDVIDVCHRFSELGIISE